MPAAFHEIMERPSDDLASGGAAHDPGNDPPQHAPRPAILHGRKQLRQHSRQRHGGGMGGGGIGQKPMQDAG